MFYRIGKKAVQLFEKKRGMSGFTILEIIVSLGIFSIVMVSSVSIVLIAQNAQVKARNMQNVQDNVRFVLEFMNKELRTGERFTLCDWDADAGDSVISTANGKIVFINDLGTRVGYQFNNKLDKLAIERFEYKTSIGVPTCLNTDTVQFPGNILSGGSITTDEVVVERMQLQPKATIGMDPGPADGQPRIVITTRIRSKSMQTSLDTAMNIETTVTSRRRDT